MSRRGAWGLIAGCALLLALAGPQSLRTLREDLRGPYASSGVPALAAVPPLLVQLDPALPASLSAPPVIAMTTVSLVPGEFALDGRGPRD